MKKYEFIAEPGKQDVSMKRTFDAPAKLVFEVYTNPKHIPNWWGPGVLKTVIDRMELKKGGIWRYVQTAPDGGVHSFHGVYHDVVPNKRLVGTFEYENTPGHVVLQIASFEESNGKTTVYIHFIFENVADRDAMNDGGAESGWAEGMDRMEKILEVLQ